MSKDIWHTGKEIPDEDRYIVVKNYAGLYSAGSEFEYNLDGVEKWAYFDDLLTLETELERTRKALDAAVDALNKIANTDIKVIEKEPLYYARAMFSVTNNALGRIQDIKQKDVK